MKKKGFGICFIGSIENEARASRTNLSEVKRGTVRREVGDGGRVLGVMI